MLFEGTVSLFMQASIVFDFRVIASSVECLWYITPLSTPDMHMYIPLRPRITRKTSFPIQFVFLCVSFWLSSCILLKEKLNDIAHIAHFPLLSCHRLVEPYVKTSYHILFYASYIVFLNQVIKHHITSYHHLITSRNTIICSLRKPHSLFEASSKTPCHILFLNHMPKHHATWQKKSN